MLGLGLNFNKLSGGNTYHVSEWDTTKTGSGSTNSNQIKIPLTGNPQNFKIFWGDGNSDVITAYNQAELTHTYVSEGIKKIKIVGQCTNFSFGNAGDKLKLLRIINGGKDFLTADSSGAFYGCSNFTSFRNLNTSNITNFTSYFRACSKLNCSLNIDISNSTNNYVMFYQCSLLNQPIKDLDISKSTNLTLTFSGTAISNIHYSDALVKWNTLSHKNNVRLDIGAKYLSYAASARTDFVNNHSWTINDGGPA